MPVVATLDCIRYVEDTDFCIDHLQHTEAEVIVEEMGAFEKDGALLITVIMQMQPFINDCIGAHPLITCCVPAGIHM